MREDSVRKIKDKDLKTLKSQKENLKKGVDK
jgi:hypothetical protein